MTIVEFFDNTAIENIASGLLCKPDKVIFVGDNHKRLAKHIELYDEIVRDRGVKIDFGYRTAGRNNLTKIVEVLSKIVEENERCIFDLDGGEDLYLVAMGIVAERYKDKVLCHRFNVRNNTLNDCDADGIILNANPIEISVEENIRIYAGEIINKPDNSFNFDFNNDFINDVILMWGICKKNPREWNSFCGKLAKVSPLLEDVSCAVNCSAIELDKDEIQTLKCLKSLGIINGFSNNENIIRFSYKNQQIKRCLTKSGQLLELYITVMLKSLKNCHNKPIYNDVQTGIVMDWDGFDDEEHSKEKQTTINEIDVVAMKGLVPVFISCKNGSVDVDELYKLSTVAERFGGKYAKKVLLVSDWSCPPNHIENITVRADDMRIKLVDNVADMDEKELSKVLASLWLG